MKSAIILLLVFPSLAFAECSIDEVLPTIRPGAQWVVRNHSYTNLQWLDTVQIEPTLQEVQTAQQACLDALTPAGILTGQRNGAVSELLNDPSANAKVIRAILMTIFDENNNLREWIQGFKGQVALATSLADLKTRIATLPDTPDRTVPQAETAVQQKINSGAAD